MGNTHLLSHFAPSLRYPISYFAMDITVKTNFDYLLLIYNVDEVAPILRSSIVKIMPNGIESEQRMSENILKWKLRGIVVRESPDTEIFARTQAILCSIFEDLFRYGWNLKASSNIRHADKRCTLFFQKSEAMPFGPPPPLWRPVMAVCIRGVDKVCLVNTDPAIQEAVRTQIVQNWSKGIQSVEIYNTNAFAYKLVGRPWCARYFSAELKESRQTVLNIIDTLEQMHFDFYASSHPGGMTVATDSIYFMPRESSSEQTSDSFILGLLSKNEIYLVRASDTAVHIVRSCIMATWSYGLESEQTAPGIYVFRLHHCPWIEEVPQMSNFELERRRLARLLLIRVFGELRRNGWRIHSTLDLSFAVDDVSCFLMKQCPPEASDFMTISMHGHDRLRLLNASPDVERHFVEEFSREWPNFVRVGVVNGFLEVLLPATFEYCIGIFCIILDRLKGHGWEPVSSADLSMDYTEEQRMVQSGWMRGLASNWSPRDLHTLILERQGPPAYAASTVLPSAPEGPPDVLN